MVMFIIDDLLADVVIVTHFRIVSKESVALVLARKSDGLELEDLGSNVAAPEGEWLVCFPRCMIENLTCQTNFTGLQ